MAIEEPIDLNLGTSFGAMYVGAMVSIAIYGITTLQTYFYYLNYPRDELEVKGLVAAVWILDSLHVAFVCHSMYHYLIRGYGKPETLETGTWSLFASIALNITVAFISQCFFTKRIHELGPPKYKWLLSSITAIIVLAHFVFGLETVAQFSIKQKFSRLDEVNYICVVPFGVTAVLSDIIIAGALVILLRRKSYKTDKRSGVEVGGFDDTNRLVERLVGYAIERCVLTSVVAILEVILFLCVPGSLFAFAFDFVIGKLYANSLLASLNSRRHLREWSHNHSRKKLRLRRSSSKSKKGRGLGEDSTQVSTGLDVATISYSNFGSVGTTTMGTRMGTAGESDEERGGVTVPVELRASEMGTFTVDAGCRRNLEEDRNSRFVTAASASTARSGKSQMRRRSMPAMGV